MRKLQIDENRIVVTAQNGIHHYNSPNQTKGRRGAIRPTLGVAHWTGGPDFGPVKNTFMNPRGGASAHLVIDRDGTIHQFVSFDRKAWHAGRSAWNGRKSVSNWSIGVELVNAGLLTKDPDTRRYYTRGRRRREILHKDVQVVDGKPYHKYTEKQLESVRLVMAALESEYGIEEWVGHSDVAPGRKSDPGPLLEIEELFDQAMTSQASDMKEFLGWPPPERQCRKLNTMPDWLRSIMSVWDPKEER